MEPLLNNFYFVNHSHKEHNGQDILDVINSYLISHVFFFFMEIMHHHLHARCSLTVRKPALAKQNNTGIVSVHCFQHREALISKSVVREIQKVLDETIKMVNYIKSGP
jgi:hypothetical protein